MYETVMAYLVYSMYETGMGTIYECVLVLFEDTFGHSVMST